LRGRGDAGAKSAGQSTRYRSAAQARRLRCVSGLSARARSTARTATKETEMPQTSTYNPTMKDLPEMADDAADRAHGAVERAADKIRPAVNRVTESAHQAIDKLADKAVPAAEWAEEKTRYAQDQAQRWADQCGAMVRDRPVTMLAAAAAVGYLLGRVMR
jgi:ElaB/YqjD/DUF883 family membrane-anchored ribosome-binding protein